MKQKDDDQGGYKVANGIDDDQIPTTKTAAMLPAEFDPRILEIVRFLARTAAEKDYAELIAKTRRNAGSEKEIL